MGRWFHEFGPTHREARKRLGRELEGQALGHRLLAGSV